MSNNQQPEQIKPPRNVSGIYLRFKNPVTQETENRCFEDCPSSKQKEWLDTLDTEALKRLCIVLADTLYDTCEKFSITWLVKEGLSKPSDE